jgi:hypothetical protein
MFHPTRVLSLRSVRARSLMIVFVVLVLAAPALWFVHGTAHAAIGGCGGQSGYSHCKTYNKSWTWVDNSPIQRCVVYNVQGWIGYNEADSPPGYHNLGQEQYTDITLIQPALYADVYPLYYPIPGVADCNFSRSASVTDLAMTQYWSGYDCSFSPTIAVSVPWGFSVGGWPDCGNKARAWWSSSFGSGAHFDQFNTGDPTPDTFPNENEVIPYVGNQEPAGPCYGVYVTSTIKLHSGSTWFQDSFSVSKSEAQQVCVLTT